MKSKVSQKAVDAIRKFAKKDDWFGEFLYHEEEGLFTTGVKKVLNTVSPLRGLGLYGVKVAEDSFRIDVMVPVEAKDDESRKRLEKFVDRVNEILKDGKFYLRNGMGLAFRLDVPCGEDELSDEAVVRAFLTPVAAFRHYEPVILGIIDDHKDVPAELDKVGDVDCDVYLEMLIVAHEFGL